MEVKIISKECIKPSSPTPLHLQTYNLSFLDQSAMPIYIHAMFFYPIEDHHIHQNKEHCDDEMIEQRSLLLKQSLSKTLALFYPLAGKLRGSGDTNPFIDCNDEGVYYVESRVVGSNMLEFLGQPDNSVIQKFLACKLTTLLDSAAQGAHLVLVQANIFECGSIALGISVHHLLIDGFGLSVFLKCWSDIARGGSGHSPDFTTAPSLFPHNDAFPKELSIGAMLYPFAKIGKTVAKRFVFDSSALAKLKVQAAATNSLCQNPTRVEVVTALIWKCAIKAFRANSGIQRSSLLTHPTNLRRRTALPFSDNTMGNIISIAIPQCQAKPEAEIELNQLVHEIQEAKTKVLKDDFLKTLQGDKGFSNFCDALKKMGDVFSSARNSSNGADFIAFSSLINFGLYEVNLGWGKPAWVTTTNLSDEEASPMLNIVILNDTRCGHGVEARVVLDEQDMGLLQCDEQLLAFSSLDPSPLHVGI